MSSLPKTLLLLVAFSTSAGCYSTWDVTRGGVHDLQSFHAPAKVDMTADDGEHFTFDRDSTLSLGDRAGYRFESIGEADERRLSGRTVEGTPVSLDLTFSPRIRISNFSPSKTVGLCVGIAALVGGLVLTGVVVSELHDLSL